MPGKGESCAAHRAELVARDPGAHTTTARPAASAHSTMGSCWSSLHRMRRSREAGRPSGTTTRTAWPAGRPLTKPATKPDSPCKAGVQHTFRPTDLVWAACAWAD